MPNNGKTNVHDAVILLAKGYDEGFVNICVGQLRERGIRTHLIGLKSRSIVSWHGVQIQADKELTDWKTTESTRLVIVPGQQECVSSLAREPKVFTLIRDVLASGGLIAVAESAEHVLKELQQTLPADISILPKDINPNQYFSQGHERAELFVQSLISQIR